MIWFSCKQCGKVHGRSENSIGTMIFCSCGLGQLVPWESTAPEPEAPIPVHSSPPPLRLDPVMFDPVSSRGGESLPVARPLNGGSSGPPPLHQSDPHSRRRPRLGPRDPRYCFNHEELPKQHSCVDCGESFCANCLVTLQGLSLCGPCKNYRVRRFQQARPFSLFALASAGGTIVSVLLLIPLAYFNANWVLCFFAMALSLGALVLGIFGLRQAERDPDVAGRSLSLTGMLGAAMSTLVILLLTLYPRTWI